MSVDPAGTRETDLVEALFANEPGLRALVPDPVITEAVREPGLALGTTVERLMTGYADRPAVAVREVETVTDPATGRRTRRLLPGFVTRSYGELWADAGAVAAEWAARGVRAGDFVATIGFTSSEYQTVDLAAVRLGAVTVPLQPNAPVAQLHEILAESRPLILATSLEYLPKAAELLRKADGARFALVFDVRADVSDEQDACAEFEEALAGTGIEVTTFAQVLDQGRTRPAPPVHVPEAGEDPMATLIYTSGSTGSPKGAIYTQQGVRRLWLGGKPGGAAFPVLTMSYMPMSHAFGRTIISGTFGRGGTVHFSARSDLSTLFEDISLARPTQLMAVPRIFDMLFQEYQRLLGLRAGEPDLDAAVKEDLRTRVLGGRIVEALVGSAPISAEMKRFAEECLGGPLTEGYGSTEFGTVLRNGKLMRPPVIDYRLVDVPELGYFHTDRPHPRGELLLKAESMFPGYYLRPELTASVFDEDGFYRTGDIMALTGPDQFAYVSRRNNVQKLSQGEFVALSKLEAEYTTDPLIRQIYVYGSSERAHLLAVIVPSEAALREAGDAEALRPRLVEALRRTAARAGFEPYEIPRGFLIETEPFSAENGLLSDVRKLLLPRLRERYGERLEALYAELARGETDELRALRQGGPDQPVEETVARAARAMLGCSPSELESEARFTELGGDSLSAVSFASLLSEIYRIEVPVGVLLGPSSTLRAIAAYVAAQRESGDVRPTFASVHGVGATEVRAADLTLDRFLDREVVAAASTLPHPSGPPRVVLLTGATGYLGRFLCLDWLERLSRTGGKLVCVVRGADDKAARERLDATFDTGDATLLALYHDLAEEHLEVLAGDLAEPSLGLDERTWQRLAAEVDAIVHPGALVNHVLPYEHLFGPNVVGTAELIRLAITGRIKPFTNISTVGVGSQVPPGEFTETADVRTMGAVRHRNGDYANGYSLSKWAGEVLLREAHEQCGLPVTVLRSDMILTHSHFTGQLNVPDMFTRLVLSLVTTGLAPKTFYRSADGTPPRAHYDGLPVDFIAEAVNVLGTREVEGHRTYHVFNPHDDGISLDTFVDWLVEAGHPITRIEDYDEWFRRFESALRELPESLRQHSLLPLLHSYRTPAEPEGDDAARPRQFREAVRQEKLGESGEIPGITRELVLKYVSDLRQLRLL
ncbi:carboxylic acid reductase [Lentzea fradiae]|uniref:carboxylic acid reductase n=1 Tax=Lentzea fradiae TaxID=200378 RepID=UPI001FE0C7B7|nr:carboxylic acid reductase [Lentzea fradiae]